MDPSFLSNQTTSTSMSMLSFLSSTWTELGISNDYYWQKYIASWDPMFLSTIGTFILHFLTFWIYGFILALLDFYQKPKWLHRFKIQPEENVPLNNQLFWKCVKRDLQNQFFVHLPMSLIFYYAQQWRGCSIQGPLPSFSILCRDFFIFAIVEEIGFYYSHRLAHTKYFYRRIHKIHHEWTAPIGITAIYAHPLEHLISNLIPVAMGPFIMGSHLATTWIWYTFALTTTMTVHSGYHFPLLVSAEFHDFHHLKFTQCYGVLGILDYLHGTDQLFQKSIQKQNHFQYFFTKPLMTETEFKKLSKDKLI